MSMVTINGVALEFDMQDADDNERINAVLPEIYEALVLIPKMNLSEPEKIRKMCSVMRTGFDKILGEGAGVRVCGERDNLGVCTRAFKDMAKIVIEQMSAYIETQPLEEQVAPYAPPEKQ